MRYKNKLLDKRDRKKMKNVLKLTRVVQGNSSKLKFRTGNFTFFISFRKQKLVGEGNFM